MAYAEKHGRGWRARWRDPDGHLRSASGFASRKDAVTYGKAREVGLRFYRFTRAELIEIISRLEAQVTVGPGRHAFIKADSMADAIISALEDGSDEEGSADG
jgi:hypothetical protein